MKVFTNYYSTFEIQKNRAQTIISHLKYKKIGARPIISHLKYKKLGYSLTLSVNVTKQPNFLKKLMITIVPSGESSLNSGTDCGCMS